MRKVTTLLIQGLPEMQKSLMGQPLSWEAGYRKMLVGIGEEGGVLWVCWASCVSNPPVQGKLAPHACGNQARDLTQHSSTQPFCVSVCSTVAQHCGGSCKTVHMSLSWAGMDGATGNRSPPLVRFGTIRGHRRWQKEQSINDWGREGAEGGRGVL